MLILFNDLTEGATGDSQWPQDGRGKLKDTVKFDFTGQFISKSFLENRNIDVTTGIFL